MQTDETKRTNQIEVERTVSSSGALASTGAVTPGMTGICGGVLVRGELRINSRAFLSYTILVPFHNER